MSLLGNLQPPPEPKMRNGLQVRLHDNFSDTMIVQNIKLCVMVVPTELYLVNPPPFPVTMTTFEGHSILKTVVKNVSCIFHEIIIWSSLNFVWFVKGDSVKMTWKQYLVVGRSGHLTIPTSVCCIFVSKQWYQCSGFLTCIAQGCCTNTVTESALKVDAGE